MADETKAGLDYVELVAAVLLGLATVVIAWSTYQAALWGGQQDEAYTESVRAANEAVDLQQAADTIKSLDQSLFVAALTSGVCSDDQRGDEVACGQVLDNMSEEGAATVELWLTDDESSPFESSAYVDPLYEPGEQAKVASEQFFTTAGEANLNGDNFELATTILTAVLFFAGIAAVLDDRRIAWSLLAVASLLLIGGAGYAVSLPVA
ncbi:MAG: hypothetical protein ACR2QO_14095 [Acidimicrobiales bacterium]